MRILISVAKKSIKRILTYLFDLYNLMLHNLKKIFSDPVSIIAWLCALGLMVWIWVFYLGGERLELISNNYSPTRMIIEVSIHIILSIAFSIFIAANVYKFRLYTKIETWQSALWVVWSFFGVVIAGCPSCGVTIASAIWLAGLFTWLPFWGLEVKIIGLIVTIVATYLVVRDIFVCKTPKKKVQKEKKRKW